jgi:hypothetical protein
MLPTRSHHGYLVLWDSNLSEEKRLALLQLLDEHILLVERLQPIKRIELQAPGLIIVVFDQLVKVYRYEPEET